MTARAARSTQTPAHPAGLRKRNGKQYDRSYFDHWYRSRAAIITPQALARKVGLALAATEFVLGRELQTVLDVGCGEASWRAHLRRLRRHVHYVGVDSSEYVVSRFGRRRNIVSGSLATLHELRLGRAFDLIVCADVLAYVSAAEIQIGLRSLAGLLRGVAYIEAYTTADDIVGDLVGWQRRSERTYRKAFQDAGLVSCGLNCWVTRRSLRRLSALERCG
jgi:SAM-dependent methyltransferase